MRRLATLSAVFLLALTGTAFAQGAGDDQYQDPFGDEQSQDDGGSSGDDGLSDSPPSSDDGGDDSSGSSGSGSSGSAGGGTDSGSGATAPPTTPSATEASGDLPRTGGDPLIILALGAGMVLTGVGLRLRTIDPDAY